MGIADVALVGVAAHVEVEAGVPVVVEGTEGEVAHGMEAKPLGYSLNWKGSKSLNVFFRNHKFEKFETSILFEKFKGFEKFEKFKGFEKFEKFEGL